VYNNFNIDKDFNEKAKETYEDIQRRKQLEKEYNIKRPDTAEDLIFGLFDAVNKYDKASTAMHFVDKFEKSVANKLKAKDKIIIAQTIHEVELEKKREEEIRQIREQQIAELLAIILKDNTNLNVDQIHSMIQTKPENINNEEFLRRQLSEFDSMRQKSKEKEARRKKSPPK
jgi:hypothetical protein